MVLDFNNSAYYENRELSWLKFNYRILNEARDKSIYVRCRIPFVQEPRRRKRQ